MQPGELRAARHSLNLSQNELGEWLLLTGNAPGYTVRMWELGKRPISGPVSVAVEAFLSGWRPAHVITAEGND